MKYQVILSDPPWWYNSRKAGGERNDKTKFGGGAEKHYPLMRDEEILALAPAVKTMADDNCALFLWATFPRLDLGIDVVKAWGFRYATVAFVWEKISRDTGEPIYNPGFYTASNVEVVLLGIKGSMRPDTPMIQQVVRAPRQAHSRKPDEVRLRIERMYPGANRIEMFARPYTPLFPKLEAWHCWGNEVESDLMLA